MSHFILHSTHLPYHARIPSPHQGDQGHGRTHRATTLGAVVPHSTLNYSLRPAAAADQLVIKKLVHEANLNPLDLDWRHFTVAESEAGEVVAIGQVKTHRDGTPEMASIVVRPDHRGQGLARAVIEHLLAAHSGDLYLMCASGMRPLYEKFGFRPIEEPEMPRYFRRIKKLAGLAEWLRRDGDSLFIMKREGSGTSNVKRQT